MVRRWQFHKMAEDGSGNEFVLASDYAAALEDLLAKTVGEKNDRIEALAAELAEKDALIAQMTRDLVNYPLDMENVARIRELEAALEKYGQHLRGCKREDMLPCSCGFIRATQFAAEREAK